MKIFLGTTGKVAGIASAAAIVTFVLPASASAAYAPSNARYGGTTNQLSPFQKNPEAATVIVSSNGRKFDIAARERFTCQSGGPRSISGGLFDVKVKRNGTIDDPTTPFTVDDPSTGGKQRFSGGATGRITATKAVVVIFTRFEVIDASGAVTDVCTSRSRATTFRNALSTTTRMRGHGPVAFPLVVTRNRTGVRYVDVAIEPLNCQPSGLKVSATVRIKKIQTGRDGALNAKGKIKTTSSTSGARVTFNYDLSGKLRNPNRATGKVKITVDAVSATGQTLARKCGQTVRFNALSR